MKKIIVILIFLSMSVLVFGDSIKIVITNQNFSVSDTSKITSIYIENLTDSIIDNIEIEFLSEPELEYKILKNSYHTLMPGEKTYLDVEVTYLGKTLIQKKFTTIVRVSNDEVSDSDDLSITVQPLKLFWPMVGVSFSILLIIAFIISFKKLNKDDNDDR